MIRPILVLLFCAVVMPVTRAQQLTGVEVRSTSVIKRTSAGDRQMVRVNFTASTDLSGLAVTIRPKGASKAMTAGLEGSHAGKNSLFAEIPLVKKADSVRVELKLQGRLLFSGKSFFAPPRRRTIYDVEVSHHDMGYADYYHLMRRDVREMGMDMALEFCRKTDGWDKNAQFHWTIETSEPMTKFISSRPTALIDELTKRIREGRIELGGLHNSVYTEMMSPELMARMLYTPNRHIVDLLGIRPSRTAMIDDVVGFTRTLPLNVPGFTIHHELAGGVVEPLDHQFQGSTSNYFGIQHFSDFSNRQFGVTVSGINVPLVEYGTPRPALWSVPNGVESIIRKPEKSHLFFYLMNNMFFTNIPISQPGEAGFSWSIRVHNGGRKEGKANRFGWESSHPFEAALVSASHPGILPPNAHSFVSLDRDNVVCSTLKPAEANGQGFILRFFEMTGTASDVHVRLNLFDKIRSAKETNLVEVDRGMPLSLTAENELRFSIPPFGVKTIRVIPAVAEMLTAPTGVAGIAVSDREVDVTWKDVERASLYRVYRGITSHFVPALINCIASVTGPRYEDRPVLNHGGWLDNRLEPATKYYYRIEAVGKGNDHSDCSEPVSVTTYSAALRNSLPGKVLGIEATNVSPVSGYNYICLLFYTNVESDVTRYRVYRSEVAGFAVDSRTLLDDIDATRKFEHVTPHAFATVTRELRDYAMLIYPDESTFPNKHYYYKVCAVDAAGQAGPLSDEVSARTDIRRLAS